MWQLDIYTILWTSYNPDSSLLNFKLLKILWFFSSYRNGLVSKFLYMFWKINLISFQQEGNSLLFEFQCCFKEQEQKQIKLDLHSKHIIKESLFPSSLWKMNVLLMLVAFITTDNEVLKWHVVLICSSGEMIQLCQRPFHLLQGWQSMW